LAPDRKAEEKLAGRQTKGLIRRLKLKLKLRLRLRLTLGKLYDY